jgi:hypothetical protein
VGGGSSQKVSLRPVIALVVRPFKADDPRINLNRRNHSAAKQEQGRPMTNKKIEDDLDEIAYYLDGKGKMHFTKSGHHHFTREERFPGSLTSYQ